MKTNLKIYGFLIIVNLIIPFLPYIYFLWEGILFLIFSLYIAITVNFYFWYKDNRETFY